MPNNADSFCQFLPARLVASQLLRKELSRVLSNCFKGVPRATIQLGRDAMLQKDAWAVLGVPYNASPLQVKMAYKQKALENHPDRFPPDVKREAEARFKHISEAYMCLKSGSGYGGRMQQSSNGAGLGGVYRGRRVNTWVASAPFALLIVGTLTLGFSRASRAYRKQQKETPSRNPFLP